MNKEKKEYMKEWKKNNPKKVKEYTKRYKEKLREYHKEYYEKHQEEIKEQSKEYRRENKEEQREYFKKWNKENPEKIKAQRLAQKIKIPKNQLCEICGSKENLDKHHEDYSKPLEVMFLCRKCHKRLHRKIKFWRDG